MLDVKDFSFFENQNSFDFKGFLIKTGSYWRWFVLGLIISFIIAHQVNIRKQKIYALETTIAINEQDNPLFTNNTSLVFNWGGTSDQVQTISTTLKSRSHNEMVVERLEFYIDYLQEKKYFIQDVYGSTPFKVIINKNKNQIAQNPIKIKFISPSEYEIKLSFNSPSVSAINYNQNTTSTVAVVKEDFIKRYKVGEQVNLPFLNWKLEIIGSSNDYVGSEFLDIKM
jgi:polysaccharide biosynthesis transport protein